MLVLSPRFAATLAPLMDGQQSWIMFVQATPIDVAVGGLIKISGVTIDMIGEQLDQIASFSPYDTFLVGLLPVDNHVESAAALHERFTALCVHHDWYRPSPELLAIVADAQAPMHALIAQQRNAVPPDGAVSAEDLAGYLGVSVPTIRRMCKQRRIPCFKVGRQMRFIAADVIESIQREQG